LSVASRCEFAYGAMGRVGFLYESVKDNLKWMKLRPKQFANLVMRVGDWIALDDETYNKEKVRVMKMDAAEMAAILKATFGDGK
jgi:hypothetical protein